MAPSRRSWAFASHWAGDWLRRAIRLAPPPVRPISIVIGDATRDELDPDSPYIRALELFCARAGINVLSLSARGVGGIGDAVAIHRPNLVVVAGSHLDDDTVARWAYAIRLAAGAMPIATYRRGGRACGSARPGPACSRRAAGAQRRIVEMVESDQRRRRLSAGRRVTHSPRQPQPLARRADPSPDVRRGSRTGHDAQTSRAKPRPKCRSGCGDCELLPIRR